MKTAFALVLFLVALVSAQGDLFFATLLPQNEIPPVSSTEYGVAVLFIDRASKIVTYYAAHNVSGASAAHIHLGNSTTNGGVAVTLNVGSPINGTATATPLTTAQETDLNNGNTYVNIHSTAFPNGAIRGQLTRSPVTHTAALQTAQEIGTVPNATTTTSGACHFNYVTATKVLTTTCFHNIPASQVQASHIHNAAAGSNGAVLVALFTANTPGSFVHTATLDTAGETALNAGNLYVNIHTIAHPGGEIRGQITTRVFTVANPVAPPAPTPVTSKKASASSHSLSALVLLACAFIMFLMQAF